MSKWRVVDWLFVSLCFFYLSRPPSLSHACWELLPANMKNRTGRLGRLVASLLVASIGFRHNSGTILDSIDSIRFAVPVFLLSCRAFIIFYRSLPIPFVRSPATASSRAGAGLSQTSTSPRTAASAPATPGTSGARSGSRPMLIRCSASPIYADSAGAPRRSCSKGPPASE